MLPNNFYLILRSYLDNRYFRVKQGKAYLYKISAEVPQGSVLDLYFTTDLPAF